MDNNRILFEPMRIGKCQIKNRYVMAPMGPAGLADASGAFNDKAIEFYTARARGGVGLIITGMCYADNSVEWHANGTMPCPTISPAMFKRTAIQLTENVHAYGAKIFLQISAGFGRVSNRVKAGDKPVAPSEIPYRWDDSITCRALSTEEVESLVDAIGSAAKIAKDSGFDGIEIHAMHEGYLLDQFAMAVCNRRSDKYGGSLENRVRFAVEIVQKIKALCGENYPVVLRYSLKSFMKDFGKGALPGEDFTEAGRDIPEGLQIAEMMQEAGYDALDADVGCYDSWYWNHPPMYFEEGMYLPYNRLLKQRVKIPVITAGRMDDPELAARAVADGSTDFIALARPLLADDAVVRKIQRGDIADIRPCLSCQEGCMGRLKKYLHISCAVNPSACREREYALIPAAVKKKIAVIGAGISGMEAARVLTLRGHEVTVFEASEKVGGKMLAAGIPDFKKDDRKLVSWYERQLEKLQVKIHFGKKINSEADLVGYEVVIAAYGSDPITLDLGSELVCAGVGDVNAEPEKYKQPFVIIGGGLVGCETALDLKKKDYDVSIVEAMPSLMAQNGPLCYANEQMLRDLIAWHKIPVYLNSRAVKTVSAGLLIEKDGEQVVVPAKTVILSIGYRPDLNLYESLENRGVDIYRIGDVNGGGNIQHAIWEAFEVASHL